MACLELTCAKCRNVWFSNSNSEKCPKCGDADPHIYFDESNDRDDDHDASEDDEEEGDE